MYTSVLPSLTSCVHEGFWTIIFVNFFQTNLFKCEEIKGGFIRQANTKEAQDFQNDSINKVQSICWELGSQALKSVKYWTSTEVLTLVSCQVTKQRSLKPKIKDVFSAWLSQPYL